MRAVPIIALLAVIGGAWLLLSANAGSGGGAVQTDNLEGSITMNPESVLNQAADAVTEAVWPSPTTQAAQQSNPAYLSPYGRQKLEGYEGFSATPYPDFKGNSIGFGHLIKVGENLTSLSRDEASALLSQDVAWAENAVRTAIKVPILQCQFDAMTSLCFNIGEGAFKRSTLVKRVNAGDPGASSEFDRWNMAGGQVNQALVARRASERQDFERGYA